MYIVYAVRYVSCLSPVLHHLEVRSNYTAAVIGTWLRVVDMKRIKQTSRGPSHGNRRIINALRTL